MSITEILIKQISAAALPTRQAEPVLDDAPPEADLLPAALFEDAPALEVFRQRAPDSDEAFPEQRKRPANYRITPSRFRSSIFRLWGSSAATASGD
ncbi:MAG: hypothetical protein EOM21_20335, partial [Gammaproteobacteria bacterium]|nr:hypothetical protein [Gammaproteobacteria bacterium]